MTTKALDRHRDPTAVSHPTWGELIGLAGPSIAGGLFLVPLLAAPFLVGHAILLATWPRPPSTPPKIPMEVIWLTLGANLVVVFALAAIGIAILRLASWARVVGLGVGAICAASALTLESEHDPGLLLGMAGALSGALYLSPFATWFTAEGRERATTVVRWPHLALVVGLEFLLFWALFAGTRMKAIFDGMGIELFSTTELLLDLGESLSQNPIVGISLGFVLTVGFPLPLLRLDSSKRWTALLLVGLLSALVVLLSQWAILGPLVELKHALEY